MTATATAPFTRIPQRELKLSRVLAAPRDLVFAAWHEPKHLAAWWGPKGWTLPSMEQDFRVGGAYRVVMRSPEGEDFAHSGEYKEIVPPERIAFTSYFPGIDPRHEVQTLVTFEDLGGRTKVTVWQGYVDLPEEVSAGAHEGWTESLEKLESLFT